MHLLPLSKTYFQHNRVEHFMYWTQNIVAISNDALINSITFWMILEAHQVFFDLMLQ